MCLVVPFIQRSLRFFWYDFPIFALAVLQYLPFPCPLILMIAYTVSIISLNSADSTPPSLLLSGFSSPKKLSSLLDSQIAASRSELVRLEETKKLQVKFQCVIIYKLVSKSLMK